MKCIKLWAILGMVLAIAETPGYSMGINLIDNDKVGFTVGGRAQLIGYGTNVADPIRDNNRVFLFLKQARLNMRGHVAKDYIYNTEWAFAAEDINGSNTSLTLLDFWFDIPVPKFEGAWFRLGQFKVPYSRERLAYSGNLQFAERSLMNQGFGMGRDVGAAIHTNKGKLAGTLAILTGGGRDVPQRFLPETLGWPLTVVRAGYNDGVDPDIYTVSQNDLRIERTQKSAHLNALFMKDTLIGHSTVIGVKTAEKNILLNSNWNPYVGTTPLMRGNHWQAGGDAVLRVPLAGNKSWTGEVEINHGEFYNRYGSVHVSGVRAQNALLINKTEVGLRYSALIPDDAFRRGSRQIMGRKVVSEIVPGITQYIRGHDFKVILDAPVLVNVPVVIENSPSRVGAYVLTDQPDQTSLLTAAANELQHQTVTHVRVMFQLAF